MVQTSLHNCPATNNCQPQLISRVIFLFPKAKPSLFSKRKISIVVLSAILISIVSLAIVYRSNLSAIDGHFCDVNNLRQPSFHSLQAPGGIWMMDGNNADCQNAALVFTVSH